MFKNFVNKLKVLRHIWQYSDSQPTEITLALSNLILAPIATYIELGPMYLYQGLLIITGFYQLFCIADENLSCRIRASFLSFASFVSTLFMYIYCIGLPTPSHWGWVLLTLSAFGSLRRLTKEKLSRV